MNRRDLLIFSASAGLTAALPAGAQQKPVPVIGFFAVSGPNEVVAAAFGQGLKEAGYIDWQNLRIEYRSAEGHYDRLPALAAEFVGGKVDLILATGSNLAALAAKNATSTIPIVFVTGGDPVTDGVVASLARPGGNLTGFTILSVELMAKKLDLITDLVPGAASVALLVNPNYPNTERIIQDTQEATRAKGVRLHVLKAATEKEIEDAFSGLVDLHAGALLLGADASYSGRREQFLALAARHRVPTMYDWPEFARAGGLIGYGPSLSATFREAGIYAGRILKGEKPADLPVQQPTTFELVVNLKTAKALGLTVPSSILARTDEVIE